MENETQFRFITDTFNSGMERFKMKTNYNADVRWLIYHQTSHISVNTCLWSRIQAIPSINYNYTAEVFDTVSVNWNINSNIKPIKQTNVAHFVSHLDARIVGSLTFLQGFGIT